MFHVTDDKSNVVSLLMYSKTMEDFGQEDVMKGDIKSPQLLPAMLALPSPHNQDFVDRYGWMLTPRYIAEP